MTGHDYRAHRSLSRVTAVLLGMAMLVGLSATTDTKSASAASYCLNQSRQFVPCYQLPAGSGTRQTAPSPQLTLPPASTPPGQSSHRSTSKIDHRGTAIAAGVVGIGVMLGVTSLAIGLRRRQRIPRWDDRGDYRAV